MDALKTLLVANRGEIAVRIIRTAKRLGIRTVAVYTEADSTSQHVSRADVAVLLDGSNNSAYTNGDSIIAIAKKHNVDAVIPGYGFLSENSEFARSCQAAKLVWVGPSPEAIEAFGIKHVARQLAESVGVPVVPGTNALIESEEEAVREAGKLGLPVMLKATAGGGGMGLVTCYSQEEVKEGLKTVKSRGETLFKNAGVFLERYYPNSHHIEIQVFGNGQGKAIHFGERECSIQRRHQKVIEECPSPFVSKNAGMRERLGQAAIMLAESVQYASAGTVEFLVDDESGDFFFLEMNTRLQVEHGITELCYNVDLVELMLKQADAQLSGTAGLDGVWLKQLQPAGPKGTSIEARVYAENPARNYAPSPGLLQKVEWEMIQGARVDTWVFTGSIITVFYDPLIAKVMFHGSTRDEAIYGMLEVLSRSRICGPPTNLEFISAVISSSKFRGGNTLTTFLDNFSFQPLAVEVISPGAYTLVQDYPGRPHVGHGIPHSGVMDALAFQIGNALVSNPPQTEGLEMTVTGPELLFHGAAVVALCGAPTTATLDEQRFPMWTRHLVKAGQILKIIKSIGGGCRSYLTIYGGFPGIPEYFGSKSTSPVISIGGYQGRQLAVGDLLAITPVLPETQQKLRLLDHLIPTYPDTWELNVMVGPYDDGYLSRDDANMIYNTEFKVSHNSSRAGIRLIGPVPKWARPDGGEGGSHPSNLVEYGYPIGGLNWTGDDPCLLPMDSPNFGGFVSSATVVRADWWKLGQIKPGNMVRFRRVSLEDALKLRERLDTFVMDIRKALSGNLDTDRVVALKSQELLPSTESGNWGSAVIFRRDRDGIKPEVTYRQGGDDYLLVEYGNGCFDFNHLCRVTALNRVLQQGNWAISLSAGVINTVVGCTSLMIHYDGRKIRQSDFLSGLLSIEDELGDLSTAKVASRKFRLPIAFSSRAEVEATKRYMETQRPYAPYLPDSLGFVAKCNGIESSDLQRMYLTQELMAFNVGFYCGATVFLPVDPRHRLVCPKTNPSRVFTPEGTVSWGGSCMSIYPVNSPGGFQMTGRTVPYFDTLGFKKGFSPNRPWLFEVFDILTFYEVSEEEMDKCLAKYRSGHYEFQWEPAEFDMKLHNEMLERTAEDVRKIKERQTEAQDVMIRAETKSLAKWRKEKSERVVDASTLDALLQDPKIVAIEAPMDANVWKIEAKEGMLLEANQVVVILEAMKLEVSIRVPRSLDGARVKKIVASPGTSIQAGARLMLAELT